MLQQFSLAKVKNSDSSALLSFKKKFPIISDHIQDEPGPKITVNCKEIDYQLDWNQAVNLLEYFTRRGFPYIFKGESTVTEKKTNKKIRYDGMIIRKRGKGSRACDLFGYGLEFKIGNLDFMEEVLPKIASDGYFTIGGNNGHWRTRIKGVIFLAEGMSALEQELLKLLSLGINIGRSETMADIYKYGTERIQFYHYKTIGGFILQQIEIWRRTKDCKVPQERIEEFIRKLRNCSPRFFNITTLKTQNTQDQPKLLVVK